MRHIIKLGTVLMAVGLLWATAAFAGGNPGDKVTAGGITGADSRMGGTAHSGPSGEDPSGQFNIRNDRGIGDVKGKVTCLRVTGNHATVAIQIDKAANPQYEGMYRVVFLEDNGNPDHGQPVDFIYGLDPQPQPSDCSEPFNKNVPLDHGNIVITDSQP
jgi:hypothetical protein